MFKEFKKMLLSCYFVLRLPILIAIAGIFPASRVGKPKISKILIIRLDRIGDLITSLPVIDNLKLAYPQAQLHVLVKRYLQGLAQSVKNIDQVIVYDTFIATALRLRKQNYDIAIDLLYDYKVKPAILTFLSAAPIRLGFVWGAREIFFNRAVKISDTKSKTMVAVQLEILGALGIPVQITVPQIERVVKQAGGQLVVGIHPGGHFPSQRWDKERFVLLAKKVLQQYHAKVVVFAGVEEKDIVSYIASQIEDQNLQAVFPKIEELVSVISGFDLMICNNSGPLHVAAALGVPTISTMGPTDPDLWWPQGKDNVVIRRDLSCSPCNRAFCRSRDCMNLISVEEIEEAIALQIGKKKEKQ